MKLDECVEVGDLEKMASGAISAMAYAYYASGATDECTLRGNCEAFRRIRILPKVCVDVSNIDLRTTVLGMPLSLPVLIAPTAFHRMAHPDGELATGRAAKAAGVGMVVSSIASCSLEEVAECGPEPRWFQLYVYKNREISQHLVQRAEAAGYSALVLTVDAQRFGQRYADSRNHFVLPHGVTMANFTDVGLEKMERVKSTSGLAAYALDQFDASLSWKDVAWLKSITKLPLLLKGVLRADDARRAADHGADGIIVSNHGGRQLDTVPPTIEALPPIVEAVSGRMDVLMDGGIRRGSDILKALALGAKAVLTGRPVVWGLGAGGQPGVEKALSILRQDLELSLFLAGCPNIASIDSSFVQRPATGAI